jgi:uncharacterized protein (DUF736 family)
MAYGQKPNTGSLFKNDRKETDGHPDYKGSALIDGLGEYWLDAWINTAKDGSKYMSLKLKPKDAREPVARQRWEASEIGPEDESDSIPF